MPLASHDANASTKCITFPKSHVAPHFNFLYQTNAMVVLMMPLASHGADAGVNGIT